MWVVELPADVDDAARPELDDADLFGGPATYPRCQAEARRLRSGGPGTGCPIGRLAPRGGAPGRSLTPACGKRPGRDGLVWALIGHRQQLRGWVRGRRRCAHSPGPSLVRHFDNAPQRGGTESRRTNRRSGEDRRKVVDLTPERAAHERRASWLGDRRTGTDRRATGRPRPRPEA